MIEPKRRGPVLIDLGEEAEPAAPAAAPPVPETGPATALQRVAVVAGRPSSGLAGWFWATALSLFGFVVSLATWDYVTGLLARSPILGGIGVSLVTVFVLVLLAVALRELVAFRRLARIDGVQKAAAAAVTAGDLAAARAAVGRLRQLYDGREETAWGRARLAEREGEVMDADGLIALAETTLLEPLDRAAVLEVEAAARQVAVVTAVVPLAFADVAAALTANLRMIRRIAEIYGGRSGLVGGWRLTRTVMAHLVATGAVAVGDDLISSVAGGGVLSKVSRRFGEGVVNGALTARVGVAAIEVCRPLPFAAVPRPSVGGVVRRALTGLFGGDGRGE